jgi:hypothetical protein
MRFDNNEYAAGYRIEAAYFTGDNRGANAFLFSSNESGRSSARFDFVNGLWDGFLLASYERKPPCR